jgi:adenylate cyclase
MRERVYEGLRKAGMPEDEGRRLSIVVLPFENLSGDVKQDYLADALTDELTTALARIPGSFVIARNTAFTYKGKPVDAKAIGKELGVRYVLEGSVQPTGNQARVNAQLIDADSGAHIWADQFDTARADLLQTQDEIVTHLAHAMEVQLTEAAATRLKRTPTANPDAEDLALQCGAGAEKGGYAGKEAEAAYRLCEQALAIDPDNVRALVWLAVGSLVSAVKSLSPDPKAAYERADQLVSRALALAPNSASAHSVKGYILAYQGRHDEGVVEQERALALDPSYVAAYSSLCATYLEIGQFEKSIDNCDKALRLSPHDPGLAGFLGPRAQDYFMLKQYDQAVEWARRTIAIDLHFPLPYFDLIAALAMAGHVAEAREALQRYLALNPKWPRTIASWEKFTAPYSGLQFASPRDREKLDRHFDGLRKAGMPEQ